MLGIKTIQEALGLARDSGFDLIEIAPNVTPPVCKLGSLSKFLYEKEKKRKEARKGRGAGHLKEIRMRPNIGVHDFEVKTNHIVQFLKDRHKVRVSLVFYGREKEHSEFGYKMLDRIVQTINGVGLMENKPLLQGNRLIAILIPH